MLDLEKEDARADARKCNAHQGYPEMSMAGRPVWVSRVRRDAFEWIVIHQITPCLVEQRVQLSGDIASGWRIARAARGTLALARRGTEQTMSPNGPYFKGGARPNCRGFYDGHGTPAADRLDSSGGDAPRPAMRRATAVPARIA